MESLEVKYCKRCGAENPTRVKFCGECGFNEFGENKRRNPMELNMKCKDCNAVNFAIPYAEKETRRCCRCGGELKEITVDFKEDDPCAQELEREEEKQAEESTKTERTPD